MSSSIEEINEQIKEDVYSFYKLAQIRWRPALPDHFGLVNKDTICNDCDKPITTHNLWRSQGHNQAALTCLDLDGTYNRNRWALVIQQFNRGVYSPVDEIPFDQKKVMDYWEKIDRKEKERNCSVNHKMLYIVWLHHGHAQTKLPGIEVPCPPCPNCGLEVVDERL